MRYGILSASIFLVMLLPGQGLGDEFKVVPSATLRGEYNNNLYLGTTDIKKDYISTVSPAVKIINKTERLDSEISARIDRRDYMDNRDLNATDQSYNGRAKYMATQTFSLSANAAYVSDSRPDRDITESGLLLSALRRNRINGGLSLDKRLSEKAIAMVSYSYTKDSYEKKNPDYILHNVAAGLDYDLGKFIPGTKGRVNATYDHYDFTLSLMDSAAGTVGLTKNFDEIWSVSIDGGARHTWSRFSKSEVVYVPPFDFQVVSREETTVGWGWTGKLALNYKGQRFSGDLSYMRDLMPASGYGGATERNYIRLAASYKINYEWSANASGGYTTNKSDSMQYSVQKIDNQSFFINPSIRYEYSKDIAADISYNYTQFDNRVSDTKPDRHLFFLQVYVQHAFFE